MSNFGRGSHVTYYNNRGLSLDLIHLSIILNLLSLYQKGTISSIGETSKLTWSSKTTQVISEPAISVVYCNIVIIQLSHYLKCS